MARKDLAEEVTLLCKGHFMHLVTKSKAVGITMWAWPAGLEAAGSSGWAGRNHQATAAGVWPPSKCKYLSLLYVMSSASLECSWTIDWADLTCLIVILFVWTGKSALPSLFWEGDCDGSPAMSASYFMQVNLLHYFLWACTVGSDLVGFIQPRSKQDPWRTLRAVLK